MDKVSLADCYKLMDVKKIIYIEDEIKSEVSSNAFVFDLLHLTKTEQEIVLTELNSISNELVIKAKFIIDNMESIDIPWDTIPQRNIEWFLNKNNLTEIKECFDKIEQSELDLCQEIIDKYALGLIETTLFIPQLAMVYNEQGDRIPIRIIKDWSSESEIIFRKELEECIRNKETFVCIVDDQLGDQNDCSKVIIDYICENISAANEYGTYILLSSKKKQSYARFDSKIYIDYIEKDGKKKDSCERQIISSLVRSNYSMLIGKMKSKKNEAVNAAYGYALNNRDIAIYLSNMAQEEGITNYEIIQEWLELRERFYWTKNDSEHEIRGIITLSRLLSEGNFLESAARTELVDTGKIRTFEEYDYDVNKYYKSIRPGDLFCIESNNTENYYLLVGQECDFSLRKVRGKYRRKTQECILLPVEILPATYIPKKNQTNGYERVILGSFRDKDDNLVSIRIDCGKEYLIDDLILDLCSYNNNGDAFLDLDESFTIEKTYLMTCSMNNRFFDIKESFLALEEIKNKVSLERLKSFIQVEDDKIISKFDYTINGKCISYKVRRMCRIKKYLHLLNKMYSEYKWRMGFETINLDDVEKIQVNLSINSSCNIMIEAGLQLVSKRSKNDEREKRKWYINKECLNSVWDEASLEKELLDVLVAEDEYYIFDKKSDSLSGKITYSKECDEEYCHKLILTVITNA